MIEKPAMTLAPVVKEISVPCAPAEAFLYFTADIHRWWPLATHSCSLAEAAFCGFELRAGGQLYERSRSGEEYSWGHVLVWDPPHRLTFTWHPGRGEETAQMVEVTFRAEEGGTHVTLTHSGWEKLGDKAEGARKSYDQGWNVILREAYANFVRARSGGEA